MSYRRLVFFTLVGWQLIFASAKADEELVWRDPLLCGVNSSYIYLQLEKNDVKYDDVLEALRPGESGTSVKQLRDFLRTYDSQLSVFRSSPSKLEQLPLPAIVFLEPSGSQEQAIGHFNVLVSVDADKVVYLDGTTGAIWDASRAEFGKTWSGVVIAKTSPSSLPYLVFCVLACFFLIFQLRQFFSRRRAALPVAATLFVVLALLGSTTHAQTSEAEFTLSSVDAPSLDRFLEAMAQRNAQLDHAAVTFQKYLIQPDSQEQALYEVDYRFSGQTRYLKQIDYKDGNPNSVSERAFDGEFYRDRNAGSYQLHSRASALAYEVNRFDTLYLVFAGIHVSDPLLSTERQQRRESNSIRSRLRANDFRVTLQDDGLWKVRQTNRGQSDKTRFEILCDPNLDCAMTRRTVYSIDHEKLSEFRYFDHRQVEGTTAWVPGTIEFRSFDYEGKVNEAFGLKLVRFLTLPSDQPPPRIQPVTGATLVNYTRITTENQGEETPRVFKAGATPESLNRVIQEASDLLAKSAEPRSTSYHSALQWLSLGFCGLVAVVGYFSFRVNQKS